MGLADWYPFALSNQAISKLRFMHQIVRKTDNGNETLKTDTDNQKPAGMPAANVLARALRKGIVKRREPVPAFPPQNGRGFRIDARKLHPHKSSNWGQTLKNHVI